MSGAQGSNGRFWSCSAGGFRLIIRFFWDVLGVFCQDWIRCFPLTGLSRSRRTLNLLSCHCSHKNCIELQFGNPMEPLLFRGKHHLLVSTIQFNRSHPKGMLGCGRHHRAESEAHAASNGTPHGPFGSGVVARGFLSGKLSIRHLDCTEQWILNNWANLEPYCSTKY